MCIRDREWHDRGHRGPCLGLELQPEASALLAAACAEQGIEHITPCLLYTSRCV